MKRSDSIRVLPAPVVCMTMEDEHLCLERPGHPMPHRCANPSCGHTWEDDETIPQWRWKLWKRWHNIWCAECRPIYRFASWRVRRRSR